ncbi:transmembrane protein 109-like [Lampris incognitus]|uniref:transmembrane protein 109-like n=1 Tax=Lampris incognitus TaxID=2546036 RepID=UPI0024B61805|nr:transmembrane protein 109-like [Lampris incognitus]
MSSASGHKPTQCTMPRFLPSMCLLLLGLAAQCAGQATPSTENPPPAASPVSLRALIMGTCEEVHRFVESIVGTRVIDSTVEFVETVIRFLAEGAASGLNVIAVYVTEILRVTGIDVPLPFPRFTPEGVTSVAQWGLLALIGYWLLTVLLRLLIGTVRRVFWMLKTVMALWLFGLIVSDSGAKSDTTAVRLAVLVLGYVLLGLVTSGSEKTVVVENRLSSLEGRLKAVERRKREE